jgi:uncharacterized membrane protein (UPF0136 family)
LINSGQNKNGHLLGLASSVALVAGMVNRLSSRLACSVCVCVARLRVIELVFGFAVQAPRAVKTGKFMPAGMIATMGAASTAYQASKVQQWWDE